MMRTTAESPQGLSELLGELGKARENTDRLFEIVRTEALYDRPIPERHRIVFYIGHLEAFDHNLLAPALGLKSFHPEFDRLFGFGIDPVDGNLPSDQPADWPRLQQVHSYRQNLRARLDDKLSAANGSELEGQGQLLKVAIEHRLMHAETLAYMFHQLPMERKVAPRQAEPVVSSGPFAPRMVKVPEGTARLGARRARTGFGWDNEFEEHAVQVPAFAIDAYNVTNGQFQEFVQAGGYRQTNWWSKEDWDWIKREGVRHPGFWRPYGDGWLVRNMFAEVPLPLDWPAYVSHAEASAYARWVKKALPTEAQLHRAGYGTPEGAERSYPWGEEPPEERHGNFDFHRWDPAPVGSYPAGRSAFGVEDALGNGWEWTSSRFEPFPGFEPFAFYPGYSANFFDGKHYVMKGGSARTAACMLRRSFRNWFQPHYPFVYAAFRCVVN